ncbi:MAG: PAS domain-containing protein [Bacteroidetes bacterium]|nr:PAS domain-containing protein [Bacteroidota bacterium]
MPFSRPNPGILTGALPNHHQDASESEPDHATLLAAEISRLQCRIAELEAQKALMALEFRQLEKTLPFYQALPALLPDTFVVAFDRQLRFQMAEGPLLDTLGYHSSDIVGRSVLDLLPDGRGWRQWEAHFRGTLRGQTFSKEVEDQGRFYQVDLVPIRDTEGDVTGGLQVTRDISALKLQRASAERRAADMARTNAELNRYISTNLELEQFAYIAAHDLKEPIRTIISFAQLLQRRHGPSIDEEGQEFMEYIVQGSRRMEALITGLLDYSSLDSRGQKDLETVSVHEILEGVLRNLANQIQERQVEVIFGELPVVRGNAVQLGQLFQNLVSNGIKFNTSAQPMIRIEGEVDPASGGDHWKFSVRDNGIGIPEDGMDKIFGIFRRLHNRDEYEGAGIGLAVCKKIVERHGGRIWAESSPGEGTTFCFTLPKLVKG